MHRAIDDKAFVKAYGKVSEEETLKRVPAGYDAADPDANLLKLKAWCSGAPSPMPRRSRRTFPIGSRRTWRCRCR